MLVMRRTIKAITAVMLMTVVLFAVGCKRDDDNAVKVTTYTPQDITRTSATCGGDVIVISGLSLTEIGVCWSTERKPTAEDSHLSTTNWSEPYVCTLTHLTPNTKYYIRAYALRGLEYYYGDEKSFTTEGSGGGGEYNGHEYIDLGLPSGTLWATCNVGANTPEDYGYYFAWGETQEKDAYDWSTYQYCNGDFNRLTKYCCGTSFGYHEFVDNLSVLQDSDDAATAHWGSGWSIPTREQWQELIDNTTNTWTTQNGVTGRLFTASKGATLFLPAAGRCWGSDTFSAGGYGYYWSSSLNVDISSNVYYLYFYNGQCYLNDDYRSYGRSVRAVHIEK